VDLHIKRAENEAKKKFKKDKVQRTYRYTFEEVEKKKKRGEVQATCAAPTGSRRQKSMEKNKMKNDECKLKNASCIG
jgi:hypothetical protein